MPSIFKPTACFFCIAMAICTVDGAHGLSQGWVGQIGAPQYFAVRVSDVDESVKWYRAAFGLLVLDTRQADDGSWKIVNLRNRQLFVEIIRDDRAQSVERPLGFSKVGFQVPDVQAIADRLVQAGGERPRIVDLAAHGVRILQAKDPDGNVIQLFSRLKKEPEKSEP